MTFEIISKWRCYSSIAKCGKVRATCTAGQEWAVRACATKLINFTCASKEMIRPAIESLEMVSSGTHYTDPQVWRLTLKETE